MASINWKEIKTASLTDVGRARERNEDYFGEFRDPAGRQLLVVADGMGGHRAGDTASRVAVESIGEVFVSAVGTAEVCLEAAFQSANERIHRMAAEDFAMAGMGTTAVALLLGDEEDIWVAHVGDSRIYRLRGDQLEALTADHSVVAEMERRGIVTAEEAAVHPRRNELLRSIGVEQTLSVDVNRVSVEPGDRFLLCSDGLCGVVPDAEIARVMSDEQPAQAARSLVALANERGGPDNVTVQVVAVPRDRSGGRERAGSEGATSKKGSDSSPRRALGVGAALLGLALLAVAFLWCGGGGNGVLVS